MSLPGFAMLLPVAVSDSMLVANSVPENDYPLWNAATAYALSARVIRTAGVHKVYERRVAGTTAAAPEDDPTNWLEVSSTNAWRMFDASVASQTTAADSVAFSIAPGQPCTAIYLGNVSGSQVSVSLTDPVEGVVYGRTISLASASGIADWYAYFFEPIERRNDVLFDDVPPYSAGEIGVTVTDPGATVAIGVFLAGAARQLGVTLAGASVGIKDYSRKEADDFGGFAVVKRDYSKRATFSVSLGNNLLDPLLRQLAKYRATPILYIASSRYEATLVYGFFVDFSIVIEGPVNSEASIEVEGLT